MYEGTAIDLRGRKEWGPFNYLSELPQLMMVYFSPPAECVPPPIGELSLW